MKKSFIIISMALLLVACGSTKNTTATPSEIPATDAETPMLEEDTPETPEIPEIPNPPPLPDTPVEDSNQTPATEIETTLQETTQPSTPEVVQEAENTTLNSKIHQPFDVLLKKHVSTSGNVNYNGFAKDKSVLRGYIASLGQQLPEDNWSKNKTLAYWMNAYNAMTVDLILRNMPLQSIKDIKDPWEQRLWKLGSKWYNLDEIEHKILRKMGDARIHFGINCASFSCPPLANEAFTENKVDAQLQSLAIQFINDSKRNTITKDRVEISKIFNWFSKDFKTQGSIIDYLNTYSNIQINEDAKVRFKDYDWSLNN